MERVNERFKSRVLIQRHYLALLEMSAIYSRIWDVGQGLIN